MKIYISLILSFLFLAGGTKAQEKEQLKTYDHLHHEGQTLKIYAENGLIELTAFQPNVVKVSYLKNDKQQLDSSYVVVAKPYPTFVRVAQNLDNIFFETDSLFITINKWNFNIHFEGVKHKLLTNNNLAYSISDTLKALDFSLAPQEAIYGLGSRAIPVNRRGYLLENYHQPHYGYVYGEKNLNISVPFYTSNRGYGIYFDNKGAGFFDIGKSQSNQFQFSTQSGDLSYYLISGNNQSILKAYTWLTGRQPLPPIWALGFIQSRFGYKSQQETLDIVKRTKAAGYPIDATVLDLFWYGQVKTIGNLNWQRDSFPEPKKMLSELKEMGVKTIPITQTFVTKLSDNYPTVVKESLLTKGINGENYIINGFWAGPAGLLDIFKPQTQSYLWNFYKQRINEGVAGWWCDLGEPEQHPDSMRHVIGKARDVHSIYPLIWSQMIYNNYRKDFPNQRVFDLARSGGAGMQRYATFPWSGDISRSWEGLKAQIPVMLGAGMSGIAYMHSDAGGFAQGIKDKELYTRWMEYAAFTPIFRAHGDPAQAAPEPIFWDDTTQNIVKKFIKLRYRMLPYNYTLAAENTETGRPLAMPLNYFDHDSRLENINDEYLWGADLLIAPIIKKGERERKVLFPQGEWLDFNTGKAYQNEASIKANLDQLPVFVKAGSFIPIANDMPNTTVYTSDTLHIKYFMANDTLQHQSRMFYDDGKDPLSIENGKDEILVFKAQKSGKTLNISFKSSKVGKERNLFFEVIKSVKPIAIQSFDGTKLKLKKSMKKLNKPNTAFYDKKSQQIYVHVTSNGNPQGFKLTFNQ